MIDEETTKTVSIKKACEVAGVSRRTIYNWLKAGKLEYVRTAGGRVRIATHSLLSPPIKRWSRAV